jgi:hypothetical protein
MLNENDQDEIIRLEVYSHENLDRKNENKIEDEKKNSFRKNRDTFTIFMLILLYIVQCKLFFLIFLF